ncbi:MAG: UDP-3-O-[3-hydroxymyristoyl] N-acetylglucosamine deacetylase, partial [Planctomycetes bacterium HGW-Planctomycetes-1]
MKPQKTIAEQTQISGRGMFGGQEAKVLFLPADVDTGVVFVRKDTPEPV